MKRVLVPIAPGFEEIEAVTVIDVLRRGGIEVVVAGTIAGAVEGRNRIVLQPERNLDDVISDDFDMVVLPGGAAGTEHLKNDERIKGLLKKMAGKGKYTTAICAAPIVLEAAGLLQGKNVTSHPSVQSGLKGVHYQEDRVVVDGKVITSRAPGTSMEFSMKLLEILAGKDKRAEVNHGVMARLP